MSRVLAVLAIAVFGLAAFSGCAVADGAGRDLSGPPVVEIRPETAEQGAVVVVSLDMGEMGKSQGEALCLFKGNRIRLEPAAIPGIHSCLVGIDMNEEPGTHDIEFEVTTSAGKKAILASSLQVTEGRFGEERFTVAKEMDDLDAETLARVRKEKARLDTIWEARTPGRLWRESFIEPLGGKKGSLFGTRRWINDLPRSPHTGIDVKAPGGTPVMAVNRGEAVYCGEQFFSGKSIVLDHGEGLYSMYFHLSEILVTEGNRIERGEVIGLVGSTGRSTGPHLHWGVRMLGARVDPLSLVERSQGFHRDTAERTAP